MSLVYRRSASIVPDLPAAPVRGRSHDFEAVRVVPAWTQRYPCPYLPPQPPARAQGDGATLQSLTVALVVFVLAGGLSAWLIGA